MYMLIFENVFTHIIPSVLLLEYYNNFNFHLKILLHFTNISKKRVFKKIYIFRYSVELQLLANRRLIRMQSCRHYSSFLLVSGAIGGGWVVKPLQNSQSARSARGPFSFTFLIPNLWRKPGRKVPIHVPSA